MSNPAATEPGRIGTSGTGPSAGTGAPTPQGAGLVENLRGIVAVFVAVVLLLGFGALVWFLVTQAGSAAEGTWSRFVYLFGSAEALVFTAVGWLFGREVNRQAAQNAEARADQATGRAESATHEAAQEEAKGRALKAAVEARAAETPAGAGRVEEKSIVGGGPSSPSPDPVRELADFARRLYPDT